MTKGGIDSLTRAEKDVLRLLRPGVPQKTIARSLGVSPETVRVHLRHCREKLRVSSSHDAAKMLALHESRADEKWVTPAGVMSGSIFIGEDSEATWSQPAPAGPDVVREVPASPSWEMIDWPDAPVTQNRINSLSPIMRIGVTLAIVVALVVSIIAAPGLMDSFHRAANLIRPHH